MLSGRYFDDRNGSLESGTAIPRVSCTGDSCRLQGPTIRVYGGAAKFNYYVMGSSTITTGGDTFSYSRSGGVDLNKGEYVRFPGPPENER